MFYRVFSHTFESAGLATLFAELLEEAGWIASYSHNGRRIAVKMGESSQIDPEYFIRAGFVEHPSDSDTWALVS